MTNSGKYCVTGTFNLRDLRAAQFATHFFTERSHSINVLPLGNKVSPPDLQFKPVVKVFVLIISPLPSDLMSYEKFPGDHSTFSNLNIHIFHHV